MASIWEHILTTIKYDPSKYIQYITSKQIKDANSSWTGKKSQFEPRLLCKMDTSESRPAIFKQHNICILSVKNGTYALIKENIYIHLPRYQCVPKKIVKTKKILKCLELQKSLLLIICAMFMANIIIYTKYINL